jgi:hypothetical protein
VRQGRGSQVSRCPAFVGWSDAERLERSRTVEPVLGRDLLAWDAANSLGEDGQQMGVRWVVDVIEEHLEGECACSYIWSVASRDARQEVTHALRSRTSGPQPPAATRPWCDNERRLAHRTRYLLGRWHLPRSSGRSGRNTSSQWLGEAHCQDTFDAQSLPHSHVFKEPGEAASWMMGPRT